MQTIEEYKEYTRQLEGEVKHWHDAYDAIIVERNQLLKQLRKGENDVHKPDNEGRGNDCKQSRNGGGQRTELEVAMAQMCKARYDEEDSKENWCGLSWKYISENMKYWERWHKRWLELAEKFKEAK